MLRRWVWLPLTRCALGSTAPGAAAWARDRAPAEVMARAEQAHDELRAFLTTVTDDEVDANAAYFAEVADHLDEHRTKELEGHDS